MVKESISVCVALPIRHVVRRPTSGKWGMGFGPGSWRAIKAVAMYSPPQRWLAIAVARYILYIPSHPIPYLPLSCHGSRAILKWLPTSTLFALPCASWQNCWKK